VREHEGVLPLFSSSRRTFQSIIPRRTVFVCQDDRTRTHSRAHVGKDQTLEQLHKSPRAGSPDRIYKNTVIE
jgi:hypothetical protein